MIKINASTRLAATLSQSDISTLVRAVESAWAAIHVEETGDMTNVDAICNCLDYIAGARGTDYKKAQDILDANPGYFPTAYKIAKIVKLI